VLAGDRGHPPSSAGLLPLSLEVSGVPQDDRGDDEVQATSKVLLVLVGEITDFAEPMNKDCAPGVAGFALVRVASLIGHQAIDNDAERICGSAGDAATAGPRRFLPRGNDFNHRKPLLPS
jgi:hypothetical protein